MPACIITALGLSLIRDAAGDSSAVAISHVALGDGLGVAYAPSKSQTALRRELARRPIKTRYPLGNDTWRTITEFPPETPNFQIREIGFFNAQNQLVAVWAGVDIDVRHAGIITYICDFVLNFSDVESGLVIVDAPDDELFKSAITSLANQANHSRILFTIIKDQS
jgi:Phage tail-collar fibre protein